MDETERRRFLDTLRDDEEFRAAVRRELLIDEVLNLPQVVSGLAADVQRLAGSLTVMVDTVAQQRQDFVALAADVRDYMERAMTMLSEGFSAVRGELSELGTGLRAEMGSLQAEVGTLWGEVATLRANTEAGFAAVGARFDQVDARFDEVDARFEQVDARFEQVDARFDEVDARFEQVDARFEQVDARFEQVDARFDQIGGEIRALKDERAS